MKPFDIEAAKNGAQVQTRDGRPVRLLCFDRDAAHCIVGLLDDQEIETWTKEGWVKSVSPGQVRDLVMAPEKRRVIVGWKDGIIKCYSVHVSKPSAQVHMDAMKAAWINQGQKIIIDQVVEV